MRDPQEVHQRKSLHFQPEHEHESVTTLTEQMSVNENDLSNMCDDLNKIFVRTTHPDGHNLY